MTQQQRGMARRDSRTQEMSTFPEKDMGSYLGLSDRAKKELQDWAEKRSLDVYSGHVILMHGKPFVTIDGLSTWVRKKYPKQWSGYSNRALTKTEREDSGFKEGDVVVECELICRHDDGQMYTVRDAAAVTKIEQDQAIQQIEDKMGTETIWEEQNGRRVNTHRPKWDRKTREKEWDREYARRSMMLPILKNPRGMAGKRALALCIKRTFPVEAELEIMETAEEKSPAPQHVNTSTGEVVDGDFSEIQDDQEEQHQSPQGARTVDVPASASPNGTIAPPTSPSVSDGAVAKPGPRTFKGHAEFREACKGIGLVDDKAIAEVLGGPLEGFRVTDLTGAWVRVQARQAKP